MKYLIYVIIILLGNIVIPFLFFMSESMIYDSIKSLFMITLVGIFVFEPILYFLRKSEKPKTFKHLFSKENMNDFIENIFIYWVIFTTFFMFFAVRSMGMTIK